MKILRQWNDKMVQLFTVYSFKSQVTSILCFISSNKQPTIAESTRNYKLAKLILYPSSGSFILVETEDFSCQHEILVSPGLLSIQSINQSISRLNSTTTNIPSTDCHQSSLHYQSNSSYTTLCYTTWHKWSISRQLNPRQVQPILQKFTTSKTGQLVASITQQEAQLLLGMADRTAP